MFKSFSLHVLESYFRHRWLNLLPIVVLMIASGVYFLVVKPQYIAQGSLFVNSQSLLASLTDVKDPNTSIWLTPAQFCANEISDLLKTDAFIRAIVKPTDLEKEMSLGPAAVDRLFQDLRSHMWVTATGNNQIHINAADTSPKVAYQLVNSLIENYVQWKMNSKKTESQAAVDFFDNLIAQYKVGVDNAREDLKAYVTAHPEPIRGNRPELEQSEIDRLNSQINAAEARYSSALDKEENAKLALQQIESDTRQTYILIDAPEIPIEDNVGLRSIALKLAIFLGIGILLSLVLIVGGYYLDKSVRFSLDVTNQLNLPVVATIPDLALQKPYRPMLLRIYQLRLSQKKLLNPGKLDR